MNILKNSSEKILKSEQKIIPTLAPQVSAKLSESERNIVASAPQKMSRKMSMVERKIHEQFSHYGKNAREWLRKCALLLPHIERRQIWRKKRFSSIYEYAAKLAGMSRSSVDLALRVLSRVEDKPELKKVVEIFGVQRVRPVAAIATQETAGFWAKKAMEMSKHTLETYVREYKKTYGEVNEQKLQEEFRPGAEITDQKFTQTPCQAKPCQAEPNSPCQTELACLPGGQTSGAADDVIASTHERSECAIKKALREATKQSIAMEFEPEVLGKLLKLKGKGDWNTLMKQLLEEREEKLEQEKPEAVKTESRYIPTKMENYVVKKTNGQCAFPGCTKPHTNLHHTQRWKLEKIHDPDRLAPLCTEHERIAHLGLIDYEEESPEKWKLRKEPDPHNYKKSVDDMVRLYR